ncbi:MAG: type III-A CRISPR-associated RAMP protein Csm5 [Paludibacteraceae bacterium]|nr:type III-A CRISPR-associated RAMP protein Csm5 [Paludibacteraceae bacterium]
MSKIKIETLTAVHIGSGETLQYGTDFVTGETEDGDVISIIEPRKVLDLIGVDNVQQWVTAIERKESTSQVVKRYVPNAKLEDYSNRIILGWSEVRDTDTLKEQIHDGQGRPYIPGSSIKGAIRTAILASLVGGIQDKESKVDKTKRDSDGNPSPDKRGKIQLKANAQKIEAELFGFNSKKEGVDPNKDVFRFLQVGDAYFGELREVAIRMVNINERERQSFWDASKPQLIEAVSPEDESEFQLKLNISGYNFSRGKVNQLPLCMSSEAELFRTINTHTQKLLCEELEYWEEREDKDESDNVSTYMGKVNDILSIARKCKDGKECILRIGHGSGWCFITGAWAKSLKNFDSLVVPVSRPKNSIYEQYDFPKTRRVDDECELLGFVKLSIIE